MFPCRPLRSAFLSSLTWLSKEGDCLSAISSVSSENFRGITYLSRCTVLEAGLRNPLRSAYLSSFIGPLRNLFILLQSSDHSILKKLPRIMDLLFCTVLKAGMTFENTITFFSQWLFENIVYFSAIS